MTPAERQRYRQASCEGKKQMTKVYAEKVARNMRRKDRGRVAAYRCIFCHKYHVGERSDS